MFRLVLSCLVLGVALAKPPPQAVYGEAPQPSPRLPKPEVRDPMPLPPPDSETRDPMPLPPPDSDRASYTLAAGQYYISSPRFPFYYPNGASASYTLRGNEGQVLSISCSTFDIESHSSCEYDFLSVNSQRFCGRNGPNVSDNILEIVFSSDASVRRKGFYCVLTVPEGSGVTTAATTAATTAGTTAATTQAPSGDQCCGLTNRAARIVNGVETEVNEYPWQAGLVSTGGVRTWCGGTVINNRYVLTAAHCTAGQSARGIQVLLREHQIGSSDGEMRFSVEQIIDHPSYTSASGSGFDFSLLKLSSPIDFASLDNKVAPACLPTGGDFASVDAIVSGWGTTSSGGSQATALREVTVQTMTNTQCRQAYGTTINNSMLCAAAAGKDSCQGDSGGPLVTEVSGRYSLIGVVSWGAGCADPGFPGVYARVTEVLPWIEQNTSDASLC